MSLILRVGAARRQWWKGHLQSLLPELDCRLWDEPGDDRKVRYAVVWRPPAGGLKRFVNLEVIVSIGAGIDHVLADPELPPGIPIMRTTGPELTIRMREYVCLHVLRLHRGLDEIISDQQSRAWRQPIHPPADQRKVGVMGLGNLGADAAKTLAAIGFDVAGWSRSAKMIDGVQSFEGQAGLPAFLARTEILICLLPLTEPTRGILNADLFAQLPGGAAIINVARGEHLIDADLIAALKTGKLSSATLDVFDQEPLPANHRFWTHPNILVTPHVASMIDPVAGGETIARNLRRFINGEPVADMTDRTKGY